MAAFKQIVLSTSTLATSDPKALAAATEHQVNQLVLQLNQTANRFTGDVNAQGKKLTNLPWPTQAKDAVTVEYLKQELEQQRQDFYNTLNRRTNPYLNTGSKPFHVIFKPAATQNGTNFLGMSFGADGPSAGSYIGTGTDPLKIGVANFTGTKYVQDHWPLPDDWVPSAGINLSIFW